MPYNSEFEFCLSLSPKCLTKYLSELCHMDVRLDGISYHKDSLSFHMVNFTELFSNIIIMEMFYFLYQNSNMLPNDLKRGSAAMERGSVRWAMETSWLSEE